MKHPALRFLPVLALVGLACHPIDPGPSPPTPTTMDGGEPEPTTMDGGTDLECIGPANCACARLCWLDCAECHPSCEPSVEHIMVSRITPFDPQCVYDATTKDRVRKCPAIKCP